MSFIFKMFTTHKNFTALEKGLQRFANTFSIFLDQREKLFNFLMLTMHILSFMMSTTQNLKNFNGLSC